MKTLCSLYRWFAVILLVFSAPQVFAQDLSGTWEASYECGNKQFSATLEFIDNFNARIDVSSKATESAPAGSQWVEIWHRDGELYLIGTEWIVKPRGFSLLSLKIRPEGSESFKGNVLNRGCKDITFAKPEITEEDKNISADQALLSLPKTDFYLTGSYECSGKWKGSFWSFSKNDDNRFSVELTTRSFKVGSGFQTYKLEGQKFENGLRVVEARGSFGAQLDFSSGSENPMVYFTDRNGGNLVGCVEFTTRSVVSPEAYWDEYFSLAKNESPQIEDAVELLYRYRSLPVIAGADQNQIKRQRDQEWKAFQENYSEFMPAAIASLPVETLEDRDAARKRIALMESPGFKVDADFPELYAERLHMSQIPVEPIFFNNEKNACERANTVSVDRSQAGVERFIGLSGYDWNAESMEEFTAMLEACVANNEVDSNVVASAVKMINLFLATILRKSDVGKNIDNMVTEFSEKPKTLETLIATDGYTLPVRTTNKMNSNRFNRLFEPRLALLREETSSLVVGEIDRLVQDSEKTGSMANRANDCNRLIKAKQRDEREIFVKLVAQCTEGRSQSLKTYLNARTEKDGSIQINELNAESFLVVQEDRELNAMAREFELEAELDLYYRKLRDQSAEARDIYVSELTKLLGEETEASDNQFIDACKKHSRVSAVGVLCTGANEQVSKRSKIRRCEAPVSNSKLSETLLNNLVLFGDGVKQNEVPLRDFVCDVFQDGVDLVFEESSNELLFNGFDRSSKSKLFNAAMVRVEEKSDVWIVDSLGGTVPNTRFGNINESQLIHCLITVYGCN